MFWATIRRVVMCTDGLRLRAGGDMFAATRFYVVRCIGHNRQQ